MSVRKVKEDVYSVGVIDWDRRLFDELIPLPDGTSYNFYLVKGTTKNALIDTVEPEFAGELIKNLRASDVTNIDYIISNHAEQDHSGSIPQILDVYPTATVLTSEKGKDMLLDLLEIDENKIKVVSHEDTVSLGDKTLEFIDTPWVHWPETMSTFLKEDNILFSCDFFGSHLATSDLFVEDENEVYQAAKRYYAEIMMPFRKVIKSNLVKVNNYDIDIIAPSHGPIYDDPEFILDAYKNWTSDQVKPEVVVPYVSMHGSTEDMIDYFVKKLIEKDIKVKPFNLTKMDLGELAISLVDASTIVLGSPTVLTGPHPLAVYVTYLANALRPKTKYASIIGSYGWAGNMVDDVVGMLDKLNVELLEPVVSKGTAKEKDYNDIDRLVEEIAERIK
ncbi:MAG TPA: FprA family A-type flavoprotein [Halanaerobiales bacterium]|nr:FprA family A-type flavoprotein [Halanaerobiales bacterium]